jgi:membrane protease YdiL (CAAX protease family)
VEVEVVKPTEEASRLTGIKRSIARHPISAFLMLLYPVSWLLFLPDLLGKSGFGIIPVDIPAQLGILLVTIFGLTSVAFLVTRIADGKEGTRALRRHYYRFRAAPQWYLLAIFGPPMLLLLAGLGLRGGSVLSPIGHNAAQIPTTYLLNVALIAVLISVWEEGGWMAFMTARLQPRLGPLWASVIVAPFFGFIHFPLFLITGGLIDNARPQGAHIFEYAFYLLVLFAIPVRVVITWVFNSTLGSLPVVALLHASIDTTASGAVLTAFYPAVDGRLLYVGIAVVALIVIAATRGRLGYQRENPTAIRELPTAAAAHA